MTVSATDFFVVAVVHPTTLALAWLYYCKLSLLTRNGRKPSSTQ